MQLPRLDLNASTLYFTSATTDMGRTGTTSYSGPQANLVAMVNTVVSTGSILAINPPVNSLDTSYSIQFQGPMLNCTGLSPAAVRTIVDGVSKVKGCDIIGTLSSCNTFPQYMAWMPNSTSIISVDNQIGSFSGQPLSLYVAWARQLPSYGGSDWQITQCQLQNASYTLAFSLQMACNLSSLKQYHLALVHPTL